MSTLAKSHDSLPYIDTEPSTTDRVRAHDLVAAQLPISYSNVLHPSVSELPDLRLTPAMQEEYQRKSMDQSSRIKGGVDMHRYEAPEEPLNDTDVADWRRTLTNAYTSATYLSNRHDNLVLLEDYGKNTWLIGNSQLESISENIQKELDSIKTDTEEVNRARKSAQEGSRSEMEALEEAWRNGVGRIIEVQIATAGLRQEILERQRTIIGR